MVGVCAGRNGVREGTGMHGESACTKDGVQAGRRMVGVHTGREGVRARRRTWWTLRACLVRLDDESRAGVTHSIVVIVLLVRLPAVPVILVVVSSRVQPSAATVDASDGRCLP